MNKQVLFRQGDVLLQAVVSIPADAAPCVVQGDVILAYGEVTGHAHRLAPETVKPFAKGGAWSPTAERYIQALEGAQLTHEEHGTIALPPGNYRVIQQREYTPEGLRNVAD
jgi:hypothetical protein